MAHLSRLEISRKVTSLELPSNSFWIIMGAALVMHGIKNYASDIDIGCTSDVFQLLIDQGNILKPSGSGKQKVTLGNNINIYKEWEADGIILIDNIPVASINSILNDKKKIGRRKDLDDIELIMEFSDKTEPWK